MLKIKGARLTGRRQAKADSQRAYRSSIFTRCACSTPFTLSGTAPIPLCPAERRLAGPGFPVALSERSEFSGRPGRQAGGREAEGRGSGARSLSPFLTRIRKGVARRGELPARSFRHQQAIPKHAPTQTKPSTTPQAACSGLPSHAIRQDTRKQALTAQAQIELSPTVDTGDENTRKVQSADS